MLEITVRSLFTVHVLHHGNCQTYIPLMSKTDYTYTFLYTLPGLGPCLLNIEIIQGTAKSQVRLSLLRKNEPFFRFYMYLVPVMVTFSFLLLYVDTAKRPTTYFECFC